jgi:hypothetical protein
MKSIIGGLMPLGGHIIYTGMTNLLGPILGNF